MIIIIIILTDSPFCLLHDYITWSDCSSSLPRLLAIGYTVMHDDCRHALSLAYLLPRHVAGYRG